MSGRGGVARGPRPRSMQALRRLARVDVAGVEALGVALGFSRSVNCSHVARLARAGLLIRAFAHGGSVVAITASGRRAVGADRAKVRAGATHGMGLRHARAVSWIAALLTLRDRDWVSDRELRTRPEWAVPINARLNIACLTQEATIPQLRRSGDRAAGGAGLEASHRPTSG